jgi:hypothetical protein
VTSTNNQADADASPQTMPTSEHSAIGRSLKFSNIPEDDVDIDKPLRVTA